MNQILRDEPLTIFGDGTQTRAFSHVADVAPLIASSILRPEAYGQVFDIGADRPYSVRELGEIVSRALGAPFRPRYEPARTEVLHTFASHEKARRVLGYESRVPLEQGVGTMAAWVKAVGPRASKGFGPLEIDLNLPPSWQASE
jgi:UDP-glucose 4-epimerase